MGNVSVLLDTHVVLWWLIDDPSLSKRARQVIANPDTTVYVSSASAWEISIKFTLGRLSGAENIVKNFYSLVRKARFEELPITIEHGLAAGYLQPFHRDPFDRMLIAQAKLEKHAIVTSDTVFKKYRMKVIW